MKTILCFGDSNTWGCKPIVSLDKIERYSKSERWTGVLQRELGSGYEIIEEGCGGRTTLWDDPIEGPKNGKEYLAPCLDSHQPLDLVIIMLGTNDLKVRFSVSAWDIADSAGVLVDMVQRHAFFAAGALQPAVLLLAPPPILDDTDLPEFFQERFAGGAGKSRLFAKHYRRVAEEFDCEFMDTSQLIQVSKTDGVHYDLDAHARLGNAVASRVRQILES